MRIQIAIVVLCFFAMLWAFFSIVGVVRRARRKKRRSAELGEAPIESTSGLGLARPTETPVPEMTFVDPQAPEPVVAAEAPVETEAATSEPEVAEPEEVAAEPLEFEPEVTLAAEEEIEAEAAAETEPVLVEPAPEPGVIEAAVEVLPETEAAPEVVEAEPEIAAEAQAEEEDAAEAEDLPEEVMAEAAPPPPIPPPPVPKRALRAVPPKHPLASLVPPMPKPDWAYFHKDMGDLSDPEPRAPRLRPTNRD